jgi:cytochrome c biogenesis protein CcmG/thiol:disulfide interchange protein DsbE
MTHVPSPPDPLRRVLVAGAPAALLAACVPATAAPLPAITLPGLADLRDRDGRPVPGIEPDTFRRGFALLNVWASWCPYCRSEHGLLTDLSRDPRLRLVGVVWQDKPESATAYLNGHGNPFHAVGVDEAGVLARALRQRGVPGSYLVDRDGRVVLRHAGAMTADWARDVLKPRLSASI